MSRFEAQSFTTDPLFKSHGCKVCDFGEIKRATWFSVNSIQVSSIVPEMKFVRPIDGWANHFIWGGTFSLKSHLIGEKTIEEHMDRIFERAGKSFFLTTLERDSGLTIEAESFTMQLAVDFLRWSGHQQEVLIVDTEGRRSVLLNDSSEYMIYCRDPLLHPNPFYGITDKDVIDDFALDLINFGPENLDIGLYRHIESDLISGCHEYDSWQQLTGKA